MCEGRGLEDPQCGQKHPAKILYQKDDVKAVSPGALKKCTRVGAKIHRVHREVPEPLQRECRDPGVASETESTGSVNRAALDMI